MMMLDSFRVGETYTNDQIRFTLDLENLGGIRPSLDAAGRLRHVAVMTAEDGSGKLQAENPYRDRIEGNVLVYTAQGRQGDQALAGRNKRLVEQYEVPTPFYGFANIGRQTYRFLGLLELLRHYQENQTDSRRNLRKVWVFEFLIHEQPEIVPVAEAAAISASLIAESRSSNARGSTERELEPVAVPTPENSAGLADIEVVRSRILRFRPTEFELFVKTVLEHSGFVDVSVTPASGDGGIDVNAHVDERDDFFQGTHVQAQVKRWRHAVGSPEINSFRGALSNTAKGIFVTTSHFTRAAIVEVRHAAKPSIALLDGERFAGLVIRKGVPLD
jgi:hypothetical protein